MEDTEYMFTHRFYSSSFIFNSCTTPHQKDRYGSHEQPDLAKTPSNASSVFENMIEKDSRETNWKTESRM